MATRTEQRATVEPSGLTPRASLLALAVVVGCIAVLWPRIMAPQPDLTPNHIDKAQGCCDIFAETDINAINVIIEICNVILQKSENDVFNRPTKVFPTNGKLTREVISLCRREVNMTCGIDIAVLLDTNIRLGKSYKQILDEVRSYNASSCLKNHYGVAPWTLGVPHLVGKFWMQDFGLRQERQPHLKSPPVHPALRERGRAITPPLPGGTTPPVAPQPQAAPIVQRGPMEGRPLPVGSMRPPMGGAGGVVPPPKSSVGFVMPIYTIVIVIFFLYTVCKMIFRRQNTDSSHTYDYISSDANFREKVFNENNRNNRYSTETNLLVVNAISGLVAEVQQQMEEHQQDNHTNINQETYSYTNGSIQHECNSHKHKGNSHINKTASDFLLKQETTPPSWEDSTPLCEKEMNEKKLSGFEDHIQSLDNKDLSNISKETISNNTNKELNQKKETFQDENVKTIHSNVEKENATVKVLGMEMTAHCEGGQKWTSRRSVTPPIVPVTHHQNAASKEISSIYLEGSLPYQSKLLVAESETHTEKNINDDEKDVPIVLSGKMTLSVINDELVKKQEKVTANENDADDDDFTTASVITAPKQTDSSDSEDEADEVEEEEEEIEIEIDEEVEEEEEENDIEELETDEVIIKK